MHTVYTTEQEAWVFFELLPGVPQRGRGWVNMSLFTKQEWTHRRRKQTFGYQRGKGHIWNLGLTDIHYHMQNKQ